MFLSLARPNCHSQSVLICSSLWRITSSYHNIRFHQAKPQSSKSGNSNKEMESNKDNDNNQKNGDVMSRSFGEGYSTRSDEEGFGGIYGGNQTLRNSGEKAEIHENHPDYDKSQGRDVKEKEKGRNTKGASD
ncbi:hypothetical protein Scep_000739 [Stephania cephalantha]|uniref:Uncharacterized protein n=1 Tax=Stephania cephalantha TaxID=152367 RepID=A0AAP0Q3B0_9MAGN